MDWTPETNRAPTCLLTADELAALKAAKHGWEFWNTAEDRWTKPLYVRDGSYFYPENIYRAKPAPAPTLSITVNGVTNVVAAPVTELEAASWRSGQRYWFVSVVSDEWVNDTVWGNDDFDMLLLKRGIIHLTEAAARAHAMAMVGLKAEGG